ncbi:MAG TPA: glycosyltransferase [Chitinophagales bacterium]|nr:glycosyltransferase [Chitinophagales bacterium]
MSRWDGQYSSAILSLAKEFALRHRVFYIDHPFTVKDFFTRFRSKEIQTRRQALLFGRNIFRNPEGFPKNFIAVTPRLVLPANFLPEGRLYDFFSKTNDSLVFSAIRKAIRHFGIRKFFFLNSFNPFYARNFPADIQPELFIYQTRDDISQAKHAAKHGVRLENEMIRKADIVFATSKELTRAKSAINRNTFYLPNAADVELFRAAQNNNLPRPPELANCSGKVILYMGNIGWARVDFQLLRKIALHDKDWTLLLVGPTDSEEHIKAGLDKLPNVIFAGGKQMKELPAYVAHADCTLIPFQCNTLTKSIYPLKINEYLAAGKPVVTTRFSDDIAEFNGVAHVAGSHAEFIQLIEKSLLDDSPQQQQLRIRVAEQNSWKGRVEMFWKVVSEFENGSIQ